MPSLTDISIEINQIEPGKRLQYLNDEFIKNLKIISEIRGRNLIVYSSGYLVKHEDDPGQLMINSKDLEGFMNATHKQDYEKGLTIFLHTPGGMIDATFSIGDYLRTIYDYIEIVVPLYAMSAGTLLCFASDLIILGKQSQLGPIDPQVTTNNNTASSWAILQDFEKARSDINSNPINYLLWQATLGQYRPGFLTTVNNSVNYSESIANKWLTDYHFKTNSNKSANEIKDIVKRFSKGEDNTPNYSHGKRFNLKEIQDLGLNAFELEKDQKLQDAVLTAYHCLNMIYETTPMIKCIVGVPNNKWYAVNSR